MVVTRNFADKAAIAATYVAEPVTATCAVVFLAQIKELLTVAAK